MIFSRVFMALSRILASQGCTRGVELSTHEVEGPYLPGSHHRRNVRTYPA